MADTSAAHHSHFVLEKMPKAKTVAVPKATRVAVRESENGVILGVFPSQGSLATFTGVSQRDISCACNKTFAPTSSDAIKLERSNGMVSGFHVSEYDDTQSLGHQGEGPLFYNEGAANLTVSIDHRLQTVLELVSAYVLAQWKMDTTALPRLNCSEEMLHQWVQKNRDILCDNRVLGDEPFHREQVTIALQAQSLHSTTLRSNTAPALFLVDTADRFYINIIEASTTGLYFAQYRFNSIRVLEALDRKLDSSGPQFEIWIFVDDEVRRDDTFGLWISVRSNDPRIRVFETDNIIPIMHNKLCFNNFGHCTTGSGNTSTAGVEGANLELLIINMTPQQVNIYRADAGLSAGYHVDLRHRAIINGSGNVQWGKTSVYVNNAAKALWLDDSEVQRHLQVVQSGPTEGMYLFAPSYPTTLDATGSPLRQNYNASFMQNLLATLNPSDTIFVVGMVVDLWFYALLKCCAARGIDVVVVGSKLMDHYSHNVLQTEQQQYNLHHNIVSIIWDEGLLHAKYLVIARRDPTTTAATLEAFAGSANFTFAAMNKNLGEHQQRLRGGQDAQALLHFTLLLLKQIYPQVIETLLTA